MLVALNDTSRAEDQQAILPVQQGCLDTLEQGYKFLASLNDEQYGYVAAPHVTSSIGEHFRHLLDVFQAIIKGANTIDYNLRRRGHAVETSRTLAMDEMVAIMECLSAKSSAELKTPVKVISEVTLSETQSCEMTSSLEREFTFAALHASHHFAMAKVTISLLDQECEGVDENFGIAPATLTYLKGQ